MHGNRKAFREMAQLCERSATGAHVVFGVDFKPADGCGIIGNGRIVLWLVADAGRGGGKEV